MRILIVDDSSFMRRALSELLSQTPGVEVVGTARDGREAVEAIKLYEPDIVTLDLEMPVVDGLSALRMIRELSLSNPPSVVVCSALTSEGSHAALQAMDLGAADVIFKDPSMLAPGRSDRRNVLISRLQAMYSSRRHRQASASSASSMSPSCGQTLPAEAVGPFECVVMGASTGGPPTIEKIVSRLPRNFASPMVIAQHMPAIFTKSIAERLARLASVQVVHADVAQRLESGTVYIVGGSRHGQIRRDASGALFVEPTDEPRTSLVKPSVDGLFSSAAQACRSTVLGILLTGMGDDGLKGSRAIRAAGGHVIAQNAASCVIHGMPRVVTDAGLASAVMDPGQISACLESRSRIPAKAA